MRQRSLWIIKKRAHRRSFLGSLISSFLLLHVIARSRNVSLVTDRLHLHLPCPPNRQIRVARIARIRLAHDEIIVVIVVIKAAAVDDVLNPPFVHKRIVAKIGAIIDHVVAARERRLIKVVNGAYRTLHAAIAEIPIIISGVVGIHGGVVTIHIDAGIGIGVVVGVDLAAFDLLGVAGNHGRRIGRPVRDYQEHKYRYDREGGVCAVMILCKHAMDR